MVPAGPLRLAPEPRAVGEARRFAVQRAAALGADAEVQDVITMLVSELVTNVVLHARTPALLEVAEVGDSIRVSVVDGHPARPRLRRFGPQEVTGRGTRLVRVLAADSGVDPHAGVAQGGKQVWFDIGKLTSSRDDEAQLAAMLDLFDVDGWEDA